MKKGVKNFFKNKLILFVLGILGVTSITSCGVTNNNSKPDDNEYTAVPPEESINPEEPINPNQPTNTDKPIFPEKPLDGYDYLTDDFIFRIEEYTSGKYASLKSCISKSSTITIQASVDSVPVKVIQAEAFKNMGSITSITLPNTIEIIESEAFFGCTEIL